MEVAWRGPSAELQLSRGGGGPVLFAEMKKKRAWGVDAHKVVQLMMGQLQSTSSTDDQEINTTTASARRTGGDEGDEVTLDLLGSSSAAAEAHAAVAGGTTSLFSLRPKLMNTDDNSSFLELELDPLDQQLLPRLPSDWKKCLDLKTGKMSFVNNTTGVTLDDDPRKQQPQLDVAAPPLAAHALLQERSPSPSSHSPRAHEFLRSKQSEILREAESLKTTSSSTSSSGGGSPRRHQQQQQGTKSTRDMSCSKLQQQQQQMLSFSTGKRLWNLQLEDTNAVSLVKDTLLAEQQEPERSTNLELDLNLAAAAVPSSPSAPQQQQEQSVCTMAMVQRALRRTEQQSPTAYRKRSELRISILPKPASAGGTGSPSFSSLTSARTSDQQEQQQQPTGWSLGSPSTSSTTTTSSAISSRSPRLDGGNQGPAVLDDTQTSKTACTTSAYVGEVESSSSSKKQQQQPASSEQLETGSCAQLVMGACTHCLMYVMLEKSRPKCPRCSSDVLVDFAAAPSSAPTPAAAATTTTTTISSCIKRQRVAQA
ncbi:unnamed protein product [Sphagnum jensenii]